MNFYPTDDNFKDEREEPFQDEHDTLGYSFNGLCPACGGDIYIAHTGGACGEHREYCQDDHHCGWSSNSLYDC